MKNKEPLIIGIVLLLVGIISGTLAHYQSIKSPPITPTPTITVTFTPEPTSTPEPTVPMPTLDETMVSIPPLNEICWTLNAVTSFLAEDFNDLPDIGPENWIPSEYADYELWYLNDDDPWSIIQIGVNLQKDCETCCVTDIGITTRTSKEKGNWARAGKLHGFLSMMADIDYLFFVDEELDPCWEDIENNATVYTFNGYYSARSMSCFPTDESIQITTRVWNDKQDWIDANPDATITFDEEGNMNVTVTGE